MIVRVASLTPAARMLPSQRTPTRALRPTPLSCAATTREFYSRTSLPRYPAAPVSCHVRHYLIRRRKTCHPIGWHAQGCR